MDNIIIKTCEICGFQTDNGKVMSNHKRWKHIYTKDSEAYKSFQNKVAQLKIKERISKECICKKCGKKFIRSATKECWDQNKVSPFCSRSCANSRGPRTEEFKKAVSQKLKGRHSIKCTNDSKAISTVKKSLKSPKICPICGKEFYSRANTCSNKCGHKRRYKNLDTTKLKGYRDRCKFTFTLKDYPDEFDFNLIERFGWYSPANSKKPNLNGVSRDHMVSIKYGFEHNIDPKIIAHPANCRIILQNDNASKYSDCCITYEQLLERIKIWDSKYNK